MRLAHLPPLCGAYPTRRHAIPLPAAGLTRSPHLFPIQTLLHHSTHDTTIIYPPNAPRAFAPPGLPHIAHCSSIFCTQKKLLIIYLPDEKKATFSNHLSTKCAPARICPRPRGFYYNRPFVALRPSLPVPQPLRRALPVARPLPPPAGLFQLRALPRPLAYSQVRLAKFHLLG